MIGIPDGGSVFDEFHAGFTQQCVQNVSAIEIRPSKIRDVYRNRFIQVCQPLFSNHMDQNFDNNFRG
jgi:hypothetical protein